MNVTEVKTTEELIRTYQVITTVLPSVKHNQKYTLDFWTNELKKGSRLLFVLTENGVVKGFAFGLIEGDAVTLAHIGVTKEYQRMGYGAKLLKTFEQKVVSLHYNSINLGAVYGKEAFYFKHGYKATLLLQSEILSLHELVTMSEHVKHTNVYDSKVNQVFCEVAEKGYKAALIKYEGLKPQVFAIIMFSKKIIILWRL